MRSRSRGGSRPRFAYSFAPRGRGECRVSNAPAASRGVKNKPHEYSHHRSTGSARHSRTRMVLTGSFVLSPEIGLVCLRRRRNCFRRLDAGVEASGPHDFAVRFSAIRQGHLRVHRIPPRVRDDRETPLGGTGRRTSTTDLRRAQALFPEFGKNFTKFSTSRHRGRVPPARRKQSADCARA